jgi:hypothetical protein
LSDSRLFNFGQDFLAAVNISFHIFNDRYFPASVSVVVFSFVSKIVTALGMLAFLSDCTDMGANFI